MSTERDDHIVAAYAAGEPVPQIAWRLGVPVAEVQRVIAALLDDAPPAPATAAPGPATPPGGGRPESRSRMGSLEIAGLILVGLGLIGPCAVGAVWLGAYYVAEGDLSAGSGEYWHLAAGFGGICSGVTLAIVGLVLFLVGTVRD